MELFAPRHLLIILLVVLVVFGTKKLGTIGADLGGAIRGFKKAMAEGDSVAADAARTEAPPPAQLAASAAAPAQSKTDTTTRPGA